MKYAFLALLSACTLASTVQARDYRLEAKAASASLLARQSLNPATLTLCPCSIVGTCECTPANNCGCLTTNTYRWVATGDSNQVALYQGSHQLGNWWIGEKVYRRLTIESTFVTAPCPTAPPKATPPVRVVPAPAPVGYLRYNGLSAPAFFGGNCGSGG